jgi:hypothetical protein
MTGRHSTPASIAEERLRKALEEVATYVREWGYADEDDWPNQLAKIDEALASTPVPDKQEGEALDDAVRGLRGWLDAGEQYARRGGSLIRLDADVAIILDELAWRRDPEAAREEELERRSDETVQAAIRSAVDANDPLLGGDIATAVAALSSLPTDNRGGGE